MLSSRRPPKAESMGYYLEILKEVEETEIIMDKVQELREAFTEVIEVQLFGHPWGCGVWCCATKDYDASYENGSWRGSHIETGNTQQEALDAYSEWLRDEGKENFVLSVEGPTEDLQVHAWILKREQQNKI